MRSNRSRVVSGRSGFPQLQLAEGAHITERYSTPTPFPGGGQGVKSMLFETSKRQDILDAAFKLLVESPTDDVTVYDILRKAGTTLSTFYKYFENKEAVINEVHFQLRIELGWHLSPVLLDEGTPRERLHALWARMFSTQAEHRQVFAFLEFRRCRSYFERRGEGLDVIPHSILELLEQFRREKAVRDLPSSILGAILWGTFVQLIKVYEQLKKEIPADVLSAAEECSWDAIRYSLKSLA